MGNLKGQYLMLADVTNSSLILFDFDKEFHVKIQKGKLKITGKIL